MLHRTVVPGLALGMYALVIAGRPAGVLEILAPLGELEAGHDALRSIAADLAADLAAWWRPPTSGDASTPALAPATAESKDAALEVAVRALSTRLRVPVAGWVLAPHGGLALVAAVGCSPDRCEAVQRALPTLDGRDGGIRERAAARHRNDEHRFAEAAGISAAISWRSSTAVLMAGDAGPTTGESLELVGSILDDVMPMFATAPASEHYEQLELGLAWTAHELRGPLLGVRAALEAVEGQADADPKRRDVVRRSLRELDRMVGTTQGLLAWASGAHPLRRRSSNLTSIVDRAVASSRLETGHGNFVVVAPPSITASVDPELVHTVVANLLRNAVAHGAKGSAVRVGVSAVDGSAVLCVSNEGPDVLAAEQRTIFDLYVRGAGVGETTSGHGLGLFISRQIVEAHGGRISVVSRRGRTTFTVELPQGLSSNHRRAS